MMTKGLYLRCAAIMVLCMSLSGVKAVAQEQTSWNEQTATEWFNKQEWLNNKSGHEKKRKYDAFGQEIIDLAADSAGGKPSRQLKPDESIDKVEFAKQYHANKRLWDEAFTYLKETDLAALKPGKYSIDGDDVAVTVFEGTPKLADTTKWESHQNFEDIHYVFSGNEQIEIAPVSTAKVIKPYDPKRDIAYYETKGQFHPLSAGMFFIVFTQSAHRPGIKVGNYNTVKHIVIKVRRAKNVN